MIGPMEGGIILAIVVLIFGVKRLPELGSGFGEAITNFKKAYRAGQAIDVTEESNKINEEKKKEKEGSSDSEKADQ